MAHFIRARCALAVVAIAAMLSGAQARAETFYNFESPQTVPVALSADGRLLFAVNTPDNRLAVFDTTRMRRVAEIAVGLEPVGVAVRPGTNEVWVVNHVSDSVDVIRTNAWRIIRTIAVGDEPVGIAFTPDGARAVVTVSLGASACACRRPRISSRPATVSRTPVSIGSVKASSNITTPITAAIAVWDAFKALTKTTDDKCSALVSAANAITLNVPAATR